MKFILFDPVRTRQDLLPLTYTRPIADCRVGIMTIREKWEHFLSEKTLSLTEPYLEAKFPFCHEAGAHIYINGAVLPDAALIDQIRSLKEDQTLTDGTHIIAFHSAKPQLNYSNIEAIALSAEKAPYSVVCRKLNFPYDIFKMNGAEIQFDYELLTIGRDSQPLSHTNTLLGDPNKIFIEEKKDMKKRLYGKSPDQADSLMMTMIRTCYYDEIAMQTCNCAIRSRSFLMSALSSIISLRWASLDTHATR